MFIYIIFSIALVLVARLGVFKVLSGLFFMSVIGGVITEQPLSLFDAEANAYALFVCFALLLLFLPFNSMNLNILSNVDRRDLDIKEWALYVVIFISCVAVIINLFTLYKSASYMSSASLSIGEYKNQGYAKDFIQQSMNPMVGMFSSLFSPLSYICLALHFYCILCGRKFSAIFALVGALNIVIVPLFYFARGGVLTFCILYVCMFSMVLPFLLAKHKKQLIKAVVVFVIPIFFIFIYISLGRFNVYPYYREGTIVSNHMIFAILDYLSQWMVNSNAILSSYSNEKMIVASNFLYIPDKILGFFGVILPSLQELRESAFPGYENFFNGSIALLVYDFGFIGAIVVCGLYYYTSRKLMNRRGGTPLSFLIQSVVLLPIPIYFFQGLFTVFGFYNQAIIYAVLFIYLQRLRWR